MYGLLRGTALAVDGGAGHVLRHFSDEPRGASNVAGLTADGVDAAVNDIVDKSGIDIDTIEKFNDGGCAEIGGMHIGQTAAATTNGGADCVDDVGLGHGGLLGTALSSSERTGRGYRPTDGGRDAMVWTVSGVV